MMAESTMSNPMCFMQVSESSDNLWDQYLAQRERERNNKRTAKWFLFSEGQAYTTQGGGKREHWHSESVLIHWPCWHCCSPKKCPARVLWSWFNSFSDALTIPFFFAAPWLDLQGSHFRGCSLCLRPPPLSATCPWPAVPSRYGQFFCVFTLLAGLFFRRAAKCCRRHESHEGTRHDHEQHLGKRINHVARSPNCSKFYEVHFIPLVAVAIWRWELIWSDSSSSHELPMHLGRPHTSAAIASEASWK